MYFGADQYRPNSTDGLTTLAHELTHVVQQAPAVSRRINRLMSTATYQAQTVGPGRRGGSKASDIDALLTKYATLNGSEVNVTKRKAALDVIKTKAAAYQVAKTGRSTNARRRHARTVRRHRAVVHRPGRRLDRQA